MIRRFLVAISLVAAVASPLTAQTVEVAASTLTVGASPTSPSGTTVRLDGLATSGSGATVLFGEPDGDVFRRALAKGDLPAVTVFTDQANTFGAFTQAFGGAISGTSATFSTTIGVTGVATLTGGFLAGANSSVTGTFGVSGLSTLTGGYASSANSSIAGNLTLTGTGAITAAGDIAVNGGDLTSSASVLNINPGGRLHLVDNTTFADNAGTNNYASQTTGWRITAPGAADFRYVFADELHAKAFIVDLEQALAGGQIIAKSVAVVSQAFTCPAAAGTSTLWVRDLPSAANMRVFQANDWVILRTFARTDGDSDGASDLTVSECVGQVSSYTDGTSGNDGTQSWTFTRGSGGNAGGMASSTVVAVDALALDYGVSGNGYAEVSAVDGAEGMNAPYYQVATWTTSPVAANRVARARFGNLRGITGATEYGMLAGTWGATDGRYFRASESAFELHGIDLTIWDGANQAFLLRRNAGAPYFSMGATAPTTYASGTGVWMGDDSGTYKLRIGDPAANRLTWDGSTLTIVGNGSGITSINGGNIQTDTITASQIAANAITTSELAANSVTAGKISVSTLSAITANLGTITAGTLTAVTINTPTIQSSGKWSLTDADGLLFQDSSSESDYTRMLRWSSGTFLRGQGATAYLQTGLAFDGGYGAIFLQGSASVGGEVGFTSYDGASTSTAYFQASSYGGSTLLVGHILPWNGSTTTDGSAVIGTWATRFANINLALPNNTAPAFVIVNKGGGGGDQFSALGYVAGVSATFDPNTCTSLTFTVGLLTAKAGC